MSDEINRLLGEHTAQLRALKETTGSISTDVKLLLAEKNRTEGSHRTLYSVAAAVGTAAGAVGSVIAGMLHR